MSNTIPVPKDHSTRSRKPSYGPCDELTLVEWATAGDLAAFDELARRFRPGLIVVARRAASDREIAEDAVQDGLLAAFKALPQLEDPSRFAVWLGAIVRNRARALARREGAIERRELSELDRLLLKQLKSLRLGWSDPVASDLDRALSELPESTAELVRLHYVDGWSSNRLADLFALPLTTIKWRLLDGRRRLRRSLETLE